MVWWVGGGLLGAGLVTSRVFLTTVNNTGVSIYTLITAQNLFGGLGLIAMVDEARE